MEYNQETSQSFDCAGTTVTVIFSEGGKLLQECMADVLRSHLEGQPQT